MKKLYLILVLSAYINAGTCLIVMGPSCAGKSTYCRQYRREHTDNLEFIDFDKIENELRNESNQSESINHLVLNELVKRSNLALSQGKDILIDTNVYGKSLMTLNATQIKRVLVFAPLKTLFRRNREREKKLNRTFKKDLRCMHYSYKTYLNFKQMIADKDYDQLIQN